MFTTSVICGCFNQDLEVMKSSIDIQKLLRDENFCTAIIVSRYHGTSSIGNNRTAVVVKITLDKIR